MSTWIAAMGTYRPLLLLLSFFAITSAQQPVNDPVKLEGIVINSVTGQPLPRALVQLNSDRAVLTGPEGQFSFDNVQAGPVHLVAVKPGFFSPGMRNQVGPGMLEVTAGLNTGQVVIKLAPEAVISGHVTGKDEEPLEGVQIQLLSLNASPATFGRRQPVPVHRGIQTDEDGDFRLAGLPAGRYFIQAKTANATRRSLGARSTRNEEAYPPVLYYPDAADFSSATEINLAPGQHLEASFSVRSLPAYRIAGTVIPVGDWRQVNPPMLTDSTGQMLMAADKTDPTTHSFEFRAVPPGTYVLQVGGRDQQDRSAFAQQTITVSQHITGLRLNLRPGVEIPVLVREQRSKPRLTGSCSFNQPNGEIHQSDCSDYPAAQVELTGIEGARRNYNTDYGPQTNPSGYGIHQVMPGTYMVRARANFGGYIQSLRCGSLDLLREPLVVPESGSVGAIEVTVRDDAASIRIQLRAEHPMQRALVLLVPDGGLFPEPQIMGRGSPGSVLQYGSVAPGAYKIFAFDSADGLDYSNPDTLAKYASSAASITVAANDQASIAVDVIHTGN